MILPTQNCSENAWKFQYNNLPVVGDVYFPQSLETGEGIGQISQQIDTAKTGNSIKTRCHQSALSSDKAGVCKHHRQQICFQKAPFYRQMNFTQNNLSIKTTFAFLNLFFFFIKNI